MLLTIFSDLCCKFSLTVLHKNNDELYTKLLDFYNKNKDRYLFDEDITPLMEQNINNSLKLSYLKMHLIQVNGQK